MKFALAVATFFLTIASLNEAAFAQSTVPGPTTFMPIGDSMTWGLNIPATEAQGGYRCPLFWNLESHFSNNILIEGTSQNLPLPAGVGAQTACTATAWDGYGGETIGEILTTLQNDGAVLTYQPQYITFMGGTNNVYFGVPQYTTAELTSLLYYFFDNDPGVTVVVSTIPPFYPAAAGDPEPTVEAGWNAEVPGVNQQITNVVQQFQAAGYKIVLNDFNTAVNTNPAFYIGPDGVHPSVAGYNMLADELYDRIAPLVGGQPNPYSQGTGVPTATQTGQAASGIAPTQ